MDLKNWRGAKERDRLERGYRRVCWKERKRDRER
jgi:hypothetical protein